MLKNSSFMLCQNPSNYAQLCYQCFLMCSCSKLTIQQNLVNLQPKNCSQRCSHNLNQCCRLTVQSLGLCTQLPFHDLYQNKIHPQKRSQCDTSEKDKPLTALFPCMQLEAICAANKGIKLLCLLCGATNYFGNYARIIATPLTLSMLLASTYVCLTRMYPWSTGGVSVLQTLILFYEEQISI